ncbi:hypothetical protein RDI58_026901 [Solanum bulbocastanum]|uniref:Cytochrome P450 n=1 Tax=Solanum bulbocastanum TaxID=147425 RepID=A0AAN8Y1A4_SOLBU
MEISVTSVFIALAWLPALAIICEVMNHVVCPKRNVPPGPRPWPIIGKLNLIGSLPYESLHNLSQKYGDLMLLKFGFKPVLIASFPEMAKEILKTHDAIFSSRPALTAGYIKRMKALDIKLRKFFKYVLEDHHKAKGKEDCVPKDMDLLADGTDTSATTVEWAFQELVRNPNMIEKANEEPDRTIDKGRWVEEEDLSQLPYIEVIIKETFRLHPLTPLIPPRYSIEECKVAGYDVPKGTMVFVNIWSLGRNPNYWDRPKQFIPKRFLENGINIKGKNFTMLPFGSGRRRCRGYSFGIKLVGTKLSNLLHGFNWRLTGDIKPEEISMKEIYGLTTHPEKPMSMIMEPRLPLHLY